MEPGEAAMNHAPYRILIIDDCAEDRRSYCRLMSADCENEYQFTEVATAEEGVSHHRSGSFDCILLDYCLQDRDGLALLPALIGKNGVPKTAVVMLTGRGDESVAVQAMNRDAQDYLA